MSYFNKCEHCGAALDPGEKCDCIGSALNVTNEDVQNIMDPRLENPMRPKYEFAGETVKVKSGVGRSSFGVDMSGADFEIEDWCVNLWGKSWMDMQGNPAALEYAMRIAGFGDNNNVPPYSNDVLGGKIGGYSHLFHVNELELEEVV